MKYAAMTMLVALNLVSPGNALNGTAGTGQALLTAETESSGGTFNTLLTAETEGGGTFNSLLSAEVEGGGPFNTTARTA